MELLASCRVQLACCCSQLGQLRKQNSLALTPSSQTDKQDWPRVSKRLLVCSVCSGRQEESCFWRHLFAVWVLIDLNARDCAHLFAYTAASPLKSWRPLVEEPVACCLLLVACCWCNGRSQKSHTRPQVPAANDGPLMID